jgi:hypothetical protein
MNLDKMHARYADSHEYFKDGWLHVIPMEHSRESFAKKVEEDTKFAKKWKKSK